MRSMNEDFLTTEKREFTMKTNRKIIALCVLALLPATALASASSTNSGVIKFNRPKVETLQFDITQDDQTFAKHNMALSLKKGGQSSSFSESNHSGYLLKVSPIAGTDTFLVKLTITEPKSSSMIVMTPGKPTKKPKLETSVATRTIAWGPQTVHLKNRIGDTVYHTTITIS